MHKLKHGNTIINLEGILNSPSNYGLENFPSLQKKIIFSNTHSNYYTTHTTKLVY